MSEEAIIRIAGLTVRYGRLTAVDGISLAVEQGEVYALLGRNGSGKSSTVRCLVGQHKPRSGSVTVLDRDAWRDRRSIMERTAVVPEVPDMPPESTALRLERFMAWVTPHWDREAFSSRLAAFAIPPRQRFDRLSKGQRRQLALALALASTPDLLILDDPTLGLDAVARRELFEELIGELADRGTTVFMTTHDLAGVEAIADRIGILHGGKLLVDEATETLKARFRRLVWTATENLPMERVRAGLACVGPVSSPTLGATSEAIVGGFDELALGRFRAAAPVDVARVEPLSLEEIFIAITGERGGDR